MLIKCNECGGMLSDTALFCPHCGYTPKPHRKPQKRVRRKLPNGFGSVRKLSGRRTNPYAAYPPVTDYHDNGTAVQPKAIGYYANYEDAYNALSEYRKNPYDIDTRSATFSVVYRAFMDDKFSNTTLSSTTKSSYMAAYKNSAPLHNRVFGLLRKHDFQKVIDELPLKHASKELVVLLFKKMSRFALERDIIVKDYAQFTSVNAQDDDIKGVPFSLDEIHTLVAQGDKIGLILLYTGMRISELKTIVREDEHFFRGGLKTKAGKNRLIPIHPAIQNIDFDPKDFNVQTYRKQFKEWYQGHTPHDLRHTTTWLMQTYGCDDLSTKLILGHALGSDIEKNTYGHRTPEQLYETICKIPDFDV